MQVFYPFIISFSANSGTLTPRTLRSQSLHRIRGSTCDCLGSSRNVTARSWSEVQFSGRPDSHRLSSRSLCFSVFRDVSAPSTRGEARGTTRRPLSPRPRARPPEYLYIETPATLPERCEGGWEVGLSHVPSALTEVGIGPDRGLDLSHEEGIEDVVADTHADRQGGSGTSQDPKVNFRRLPLSLTFGETKTKERKLLLSSVAHTPLPHCSKLHYFLYFGLPPQDGHRGTQ